MTTELGLAATVLLGVLVLAWLHWMDRDGGGRAAARADDADPPEAPRTGSTPARPREEA